MKYRYKYEGPVMVNNKVVTLNWKGDIIADTEDIARHKIEKKFLEENKVTKNYRVYLPKRLIKMEAVMS